MEHITFDCSRCHKGVAGSVEHVSYFPGEHGDIDPAVILTKCPLCGYPALIQVDIENFGPEADICDSQRVWPEPSRCLSDGIMPTAIRKDLQDAIRSYNSNIYSACVVLCGRALERMVKEKVHERTIASGLKKLKDNDIIDGRLYEWADALRRQRNIGAHASEVEVTKENAGDVLDFLMAICEYVYILTGKFEQFKSRQTSDDQIHQPNQLAKPTPGAAKPGS